LIHETMKYLPPRFCIEAALPSLERMPDSENPWDLNAGRQRDARKTIRSPFQKIDGRWFQFASQRTRVCAIDNPNDISIRGEKFIILTHESPFR